MQPAPVQLKALFQRLLKAYGPQHWWPAESGFEVMVGAVLTQNTAWTNVEKSIANLKQANVLGAKQISALGDDQLADLIRPSGYFNVKSRRLKNLTHWFLNGGGFKKLGLHDDQTLRNSILEVNGVGPETADDILLYAFNRPVFVIDTYTRRLLRKLSLIQGDESYEDLRAWFEDSIEPDVSGYNEYHALIVRHAKEKCQDKSCCCHCAVEKLPL